MKIGVTAIEASFDILRFKRLQEYLLRMYRMRSGPFEGPKTVKPPALPVDTLLNVHIHSKIIGTLERSAINYDGADFQHPKCWKSAKFWHCLESIEKPAIPLSMHPIDS
jgi:hypothetical protein